MGNLSVPTPVFVAGGALCLLAGYLVGAVTGPDTPDRTTATVSSYDRSSGELCLSGEAAKDQAGADADGRICGTWRRSTGSQAVPRKGEQFRFVALSRTNAQNERANVIYGDVVD